MLNKEKPRSYPEELKKVDYIFSSSGLSDALVQAVEIFKRQPETEYVLFTFSGDEYRVDRTGSVQKIRQLSN